MTLTRPDHSSDDHFSDDHFSDDHFSDDHFSDSAFPSAPAVTRLFDPLDDVTAASIGALGEHDPSVRAVNGASPPAVPVDPFRGTTIPDDGWDLASYLQLLSRDIVPGAVTMASPRNLAHMTSPVHPVMAPLAALIVSLNQNLVRTDASPTLTLCERQSLGMLHRLVYDEDPDFYRAHVQHPDSTLGILVSGGTLANVTAIWHARDAALPGGSIRRSGLADALGRAGHRGAVVVGPRSMHYSMAKAAHLIGIGEANLVRVRVDADDRVDPRALRRAVRRCRDDGLLVLAVVGVAGSTNSGAVDPLGAVADVAEEAGCHFHVDAAWGGPVLLSARRRHLLAGVSRADTVTLDGHKQFHLPVGAGFLLFRDPAAAAQLEHAAAYTVRSGSGDLGLRSPEGSRPATALMLHAALHLLGRSGYGQLVDLAVQQASHFAAMVRSRPRFQLLREPQLNIVVYRYVPSSGSGMSSPRDVDALNVAIQRLQRLRGLALVSRTTTTVLSGGPQGVIALRAVLANPTTTDRDLAAILEEQERLGQHLERGLVDFPECND